MLDRLLNNWKSKLASLLVAIAVWYLFKENIRRQDQGPIVSDPGVLNASASAPTVGAGTGTACGIPGIATVLVSVGTSPPWATVVTERRQRHLLRLHWFEHGTFSTSIAEYPAHRCG